MENAYLDQLPDLLPAWQQVLRRGFLPQMPDKGLLALKVALETDDPRLTQGSTTTPPPLMCVQGWPIEAADAIAFAYWHANDLQTVGECEEAFAKSAYDCDRAMGEQAACRHWLNFWDDSARDVAFSKTLAEVQLELARRESLVPA